MSKAEFVTVVAALTLLSPPAAGAVPTSYSDPTGDNGAAADIGAVGVELAPDGYIVIKSAVANLPAPGQPGSVVIVFDTDRNGSTGELMGGDYALVFDFAELRQGFFRWSGTEYVAATGDVTSIMGAGTAEFRIRPEALGGVAAFNFTLAVASGAPDAGQTDWAPDNGTWFFEPAKPVVAPVTVERAHATFVPAAPKAGATFQAPVIRITLSNGRKIVAQKYRCVAQLGGRLLRGSGKGGCTFRLPKNAKGKRLRVSLFVTYGGITDEFEPYVFKVR